MVVAGQISDRLAAISESVESQTILDAVPTAWKLNAKAKKAFVSFIKKRATFVVNTLTKTLFPQQADTKQNTLFD